MDRQQGQQIKLNSGGSDKAKEMVIIAVSNFDAGTFRFPEDEEDVHSLVTLSSPGRITVQLSTLRS